MFASSSTMTQKVHFNWFHVAVLIKCAICAEGDNFVVINSILKNKVAYASSYKFITITDKKSLNYTL